MYSKETLMRYGKYRMYKSAEVPKEYLTRIYASGQFPDAELIEYLKTHKEELGLSSFYRKFSDKRPDSKKSKKCEKVAYFNEQWARNALSLMESGGKRRPKRFKLRCYYCEKCGFWHLTSMSQEVWQSEPGKKKAHHKPGSGRPS